MTRLLTLLFLMALALGLLPSCAPLTLVRVQGPAGVQVSIGGSKAQVVPFEVRLHGRQSVVISIDQDALKKLGLSAKELELIAKNETSVLDGTLEVLKSKDEFAKLTLDTDNLKYSMLNYAGFSWEYWDSSKRVILRFSGRARMKQ